MPPDQARFRHKRPHDLTLHEAVFRCPTEFIQTQDESVYPEAYLHYRTRGHLPIPRSLLDQCIRTRMKIAPVRVRRSPTSPPWPSPA